MSGPPRVILALRPEPERRIEQLLFGPQATLHVVATVAEADELERLLDAGHQAALISPDLPGLSAGHCARARAAGLRLLGLALDQRDRDELQALGVDGIVDEQLTAEALAAALSGDREPGEPPLERSREPSAQPTRRERAGTIIAGVGAHHSSGSSELIGSLAALTRWPTLLVELDALGGGLALRLGAARSEGSLAAVARALEGGERDLPGLLRRWLLQPAGWPALLPLADTGEETLRALAHPGSVRHTLATLAEHVPLLMVDVGFLLDAGGELPEACRIHREALVSADAIILCLGAREPQLEHGLRQLDLLLGPLQIPTGKLRIVCNGLGGPGSSDTRGLQEGLFERLRARKLTVDCWLPWDARALRAATKTGLPISVARRRSPYRRALTRFLDQLLLPTAPVARERKQPLFLPDPEPPDEELPLPWRS